MSKFFLYRKQSGHGCDYTIDCGAALNEISNVASYDEALAKILDGGGDDDDFYPHRNGGDSQINWRGDRLSKLQILEVQTVHDVVPVILAEQKKAAQARAEAVKSTVEQAEKKELARLKEKYRE